MSDIQYKLTRLVGILAPWRNKITQTKANYERHLRRWEEWQEEISSKWYDLEPRPHMTQSRCATSISSNLAGNLCLDHVLGCASACRESFRVFTFRTCFINQPAGPYAYCQGKARYSWSIFRKISPYKPMRNPVKRAISWHGTLSCVLWRALSRLQEMPSRFGKSALISISRGLSTRAPMCGRGHQSSIFSSQAWIGARFLNRGIPLWSPAPVKLVWRDWKFCHCMEGMNAKSVAPRESAKSIGAMSCRSVATEYISQQSEWQNVVNQKWVCPPLGPLWC